MGTIQTDELKFLKGLTMFLKRSLITRSTSNLQSPTRRKAAPPPSPEFMSSSDAKWEPPAKVVLLLRDRKRPKIFEEYQSDEIDLSKVNDLKEEVIREATNKVVIKNNKKIDVNINFKIK